MPVYEYACGSCGNSFDVKQRFSDEPIAVCPDCGSSVQRVLHAAGIIFKGSGWYKTDSRGPNSSTDSVAKSSEPAASSSADSTKSDTSSSTKTPASTAADS